jgi:hypothetical protein
MAKTSLVERQIVSAQLAAADVLQLRELAEQGDRSLSAEIRIAVREHVRNELRAETSTELQDEL